MHMKKARVNKTVTLVSLWSQSAEDLVGPSLEMRLRSSSIQKRFI